MSVDKYLFNLVPEAVWKKYEIQYTDVLEPITKVNTHYYKISIVTTGMNVVSNLKYFYEKNILNTIDYTGVEFILLNYNS